MRKAFPFLLIILFLASCGSTDEKESIKEQIKTYKDEVSQLNLQITELETELEAMGYTEKTYNTPVRVIEIQERPFRHYFQVSGNVDAVDKAFISPELNGQVKEILVKEGDNVVKRQLLARLNTSVTETTIREVQTALDLAQTLYVKQKQLWDKNIGSEVQYLQAQNNVESLEGKLQTLKAQLEMAYVRSPIDGIVDAINIEEGELGMPGMQMMQVISLGKLSIFAEVSEKYLPVISKGDDVLLSFPSFPDLGMEVPVYRTGNVVNISNRTFPVELRIDNIEAMLKPNIIALITFLDYSNENALIVPSIIIKEDVRGPYIYVARDVEGKSIARKLYIETGKSYIDETMVVSGLKSGDKVITEGYSLVTDGTEVNIK